MEYTIIVCAPAADNPANQYIAPFSGASMGEFFMKNGMDALIVYDDLSKQAVAYRQISLILKRRLAVKRIRVTCSTCTPACSSAPHVNDNGNGSTALPIVETQAGDVSAYIPTSDLHHRRSGLPETDLFNQGIRPAVSVGLSVSRVGSAAQIKAIKKVAGKVKLQLAQFRELAAFAQFGSDLDEKTKAQLDRGARVVELFKQTAFNPIPVEIQTSLIWAVQNGFFDSVDVKQIVAATSSLREFLETRGAKLMDQIRSEKKLSDEIEAGLKSSLEEWKAGFSA